ncbi:MAG: hypothetical protein P8Z71_05365 [Candidatus Sulfobium sp.]
MKKRGISILVLAVTVFFFAGETFGGMGYNSGKGWAAGSRYNRLYDPGTVETDSGEVVSVQKMVPMRGMSGGLHFILKSDRGTISVHLGPLWFLEKEGVKIEPKDHVTVSGSRIIFRGKPALIAAEIRKGEKTWRLRDDRGVPLWSMRRGM